MNQEALKKKAAAAALQYIESGAVVGVGSGSTVNFFIEALTQIKGKVESAVAASGETEQRLRAAHIPVCDLNAVDGISVYIDGADEANAHHYLIKGRGGAMTREKIIATVAKKFICMIDETKRVEILGMKAPVPVEVIPMARGHVARQLVKMGGDPIYRQGFKTDNGNMILDVFNLKILDPLQLEQNIKCITGVVDSGLFASRRADILLIAADNGVQTLAV